jgi:hypothetical protein
MKRKGEYRIDLVADFTITNEKSIDIIRIELLELLTTLLENPDRNGGVRKYYDGIRESGYITISKAWKETGEPNPVGKTL